MRDDVQVRATEYRRPQAVDLRLGRAFFGISMKTTLRTALAAAAAGVIASLAFATADQKLKCTLTGKEVAECCCVEKGGKLICTLADKPVEKCCCEAVK